MDSYRLEAKTMVIHRKWYYNSEKKRFSVDIYYDEINITVRSNKEVILDIGECTVGEDLIKYFNKNYPDYGFCFLYQYSDGMMLRDAPEDVRQYIKNLPDSFFSDFRGFLGCDIWLDAALNEYGWECDKSENELWVNEYEPEIKFYPRSEERAELIIPVETEPSEPMEEVK